MTCEKKTYPNANQAEKRAKAIEAEEGKPIYWYRCLTCNKWHLTSKKPAKRSYKSKITGKRNR